MKQFLIFIFGLLSILIFICGMVCGIQTIVVGGMFNIVCAVVFMVVWGYLIIDWLKSNGPDMLYKQFFEK